MLEIEIVDVEQIKGGVQVFARAWRDGEQVGFGVDGTVDIERFRIFNPPVLVPDENGGVVRIIPADLEFGTDEVVKFYREDPEEAILQAVEHTISIMKNTHDSSSISPGKVGNTTSVFFSEETANSFDGWMNTDNSDTSWASARGQSTATGSAVDNDAELRVYVYTNGSTYQISRGIVGFDTRDIPDTDTISGATLSISYDNGKQDNDNDSEAFISIATASPNSETAISVNDFPNFGSEVVDSGERVDISTIASGYYPYTLNATGIAHINKTASSFFMVMEGHDLLNAAPTGYNRADFDSADVTGTTQDPKLVVEHAGGAPATPTANALFMSNF